ncbi:MAG TPA: diacylglycerol kinase family protein, partial [Gammaproteobacteria bacterium]|nr:diacylglycerol kinase family protein [Gammaproteobacteria bacterium]
IPPERIPMPTPLILNPAAGRGAAVRFEPALCAELATLGIAVDVVHSTAPGDVASRVAAALVARPERVLIAGGDGTVHEAVNGWMQAGGGAPLGIIPAGTGNDFMKMLDQKPDDWRAACRLIARGRVREMDIARCNDFYFANSLGIGLDAQVALAANRMRWLHGTLVYGVALFKTLLRDHRTPRVRVTHDGETFETGITLLAAQNGRVEGGSFRLAPHAELDDGLLDVVLARAMSRLRVLALLPRVLTGTHLSHPAIRAFRTRQLIIESREGLPVHADGEIRYQAAQHLEIEVLPRRLRVIA